MTPLAAGASIGILGGGQLGRMLASAGAALGFDMHIFCPEEDTPAARVAASHWQADYTDAAALLAFAKACDVVTLEFENVPVAAADVVAGSGTPLYPGARSLAVSQDRVTEKRFLNEAGIATADYVPIHARAQLIEALEALGGTAVLKTRRDGYDGKGQAWLRSPKDVGRAWSRLEGAPSILEAAVPFKCEISVLVARGANGETATWAPPRNIHKDGILVQSVVPSGVSAETQNEARALAVKLVDELGHVGVLALEFFVMKDGSLLANEFAPRVHNSGHWTPEICPTGQFEQHIRAISGWPLGDTSRMFDAEMDNLIGEAGVFDPAALKPNETLTLYGKREARKGRKMGHITRRLAPRTDED